MKLLLTSAGIVPEIKEEFIGLLPKKPEECKLILVTTAKEIVDKVRLQKTKRLISDCGIKDIEELDIKDKTEEELRKLFLVKISFLLMGVILFVYYIMSEKQVLTS